MKKPYIIGIAGGSASGKSTFSDKLERQLNQYSIRVFHMDSYFKPENERPFVAAPVTKKVYMDDNHPDTIDLKQLVADLKEAITGSYDIIIIEGFLALWYEDIYSNLDLKLFVDCRADERIVRRLRRNMEWGLTFDEVSEVYLDMVRYRHDEYVEPTKWRADIIINGSSPQDKVINMILNYVMNEIIVG
jgi:uridine kinase